jgi:hypothetical protein
MNRKHGEMRCMHKILDEKHERNKSLGKLRYSWKNSNTKLYLQDVGFDVLQ